MTEDQLEDYIERQREILENGWLTGKYDTKQYDREIRRLDKMEKIQRRKNGI